MLKLYILIGFMSISAMLCTNESQNMDFIVEESFNKNIVKALLANDLDLAKSIIKYNPYINYKDRDLLSNSRTSIVHWAAYFNITNILYNYNSVDVYKKSVNGITPLDLAVKNNSYQVVELFLRNALNKKQVLDILKTIKKLNPGLVCELGIKLSLVMDQDLDVKNEILNILKSANVTVALFFALALLDCSTILELLDSNLNIDINAQNQLSLTALMFALESPNNAINEEIILKILDLNPDINIQDINGTTAFMIALRNHNGRVTENILLKMLDFNPDINIQDVNGTTAFMIASRNKSGTVTNDIWLRFLTLIDIS